MTLYCIILCYIQITRVLFSAGPLIYTGTAHILTTPYSYYTHTSSHSNSSSMYSSSSISIQHIDILYYVLYFIVGIALHVNFYPWT